MPEYILTEYIEYIKLKAQLQRKILTKCVYDIECKYSWTQQTPSGSCMLWNIKILEYYSAIIYIYNENNQI